MAVSAAEDTGRNRRGVLLHRRRWRGPDPRVAGLLIHGIGEHTGRYDHVGHLLAERGFDLVGFDLQGFGLSGGERAYIESFDQHLDDIEDQLGEVMELSLPTVLIGHSMGGLAAAAYAVSDRPSPDLLVLSAPALAAGASRWRRVAAPILARVAPRLRVPNTFDLEVLSTDPAVIEAYRDDPLVCRFATPALGAAMFATMASTSAALDRVDVPTLVLHGEDDRLVPPAASALPAEHPGVTRITYPGLRHEIFNEPGYRRIVATIADWVYERLATG